MADRKYPKNCAVVIGPGRRPANVVRHGRDSGGIYTTVRFDDGTTDDYHRSALHDPTAEELRRWPSSLWGLTRSTGRR